MDWWGSNLGFSENNLDFLGSWSRMDLWENRRDLLESKRGLLVNRMGW